MIALLMLSILTNPGYAKLFMAQCLALLGTGLLTVALGLIAYDLAGEQAGIVLGTALTIKMVAYVGIAPLANALFARFQRKTVLIAADLVRALVALALPFVDATWQIYALIFVLQTASATFTPAFQATIPDILPDEAEYTKALSLSRLAYDLENIISPTLAGLLLTIITYHWLFVGTVAGFCCSMLLVMATRLPGPDGEMKERSFQDRLTRGARIYLATPPVTGPAGTELCRDHRRCDGNRQHGGHRPHHLCRIGKRCCSCPCSFRPGLDDCSPVIATDAGKGVGPTGHVCRCGGVNAGSGGDGHCHPVERLDGVAGSADGVAAAWPVLQHHPDAIGALVAAFLAQSGPHRPVYGSICPVTCLLAVQLSPGGMAGSQLGHGCDICRFCRAVDDCIAGGVCAVAPQFRQSAGAQP